jgi:hypothetical protein
MKRSRFRRQHKVKVKVKVRLAADERRPTQDVQVRCRPGNPHKCRPAHPHTPTHALTRSHP